MEVKAELITCLKVRIGHDGYCRGGYDSSDEWYETFYGDTTMEIAKNMSEQHFNGFPKVFELEKIELLKYNGISHEHKILAEYNKYKPEKLIEEFQQFNKDWESEELKTIRRALFDAQNEAKRKEQEAIAEAQRIENSKKEYNKFLELKKKFEGN